jgi:hypothetical protein
MSYVQAQDDVITLRYVCSELQLVDFFTRAQTRAQHRFSLLSSLSFRDPSRVCYGLDICVSLYISVCIRVSLHLYMYILGFISPFP